MGSGETTLVDAPAPRLDPGHVLIRTSCSLISAGTERMLVEFGRASMLEKARQQPEKVRMVLEKVRTDGLVATLDAVRSKLDQPLPLGYCNAGIVLEVGRGVTDLKPGDRVASNGPHASVVSVPRNLCARVPEGVDQESAAFTVLASIGLQGVRLAQPTLGETVVVTGLGLIGLVTVQLLRANGCRVMGIDFDPARLELARKLGAHPVNPAAGQDPVAAAQALTEGRGVDAVVITASTKSSDPVSQAARMCRKRGRIVLVGVTGLELNRSEFYEKELTFQVSCSYGPGRYDPSYEAGGHDYPLGLVRWTEQRNFEAVLQLMAEGRLDVRPLISQRIPFEDATQAYEQLTTNPDALGIVLTYGAASPQDDARRVSLGATAIPASSAAVGFIGAGNYGSRVLIPAFARAGARLDTVVTSTGATGVHHGRKFGFATASTDVQDVLANPNVDTVVIATRHDSHARLAQRALAAGKHVFVEKPLALTLEEVDALEREVTERRRLLMVGFNRRFSPLVVKLRSLLSPIREPKAFLYTCSAGMIPPAHWTQDREVGGGRVVGEACHFVDLLRHLAGAPISDFHVRCMGRGVPTPDDKAIISLRFEDGSIGAIHYLANGGKAFPKERLEVFAADGVLQLDNYVALRGFGWRGFSRQRLWRQDKGQAACAQAFVEAVRAGGVSPIPAPELFEVARVTIRMADQLRLEA